ncbi:unnamed protein product [Clavelina lepadiformis]|uniref:Uncharacterized protein n=1 Tax=Clavelina lepadiformis TaxID=159417 RepID=A0ABP0GQN2_CLALP
MIGHLDLGICGHPFLHFVSVSRSGFTDTLVIQAPLYLGSLLRVDLLCVYIDECSPVDSQNKNEPTLTETHSFELSKTRSSTLKFSDSIRSFFSEEMSLLRSSLSHISSLIKSNASKLKPKKKDGYGVSRVVIRDPGSKQKWIATSLIDAESNLFKQILRYLFWDNSIAIQHGQALSFPLIPVPSKGNFTFSSFLSFWAFVECLTFIVRLVFRHHLLSWMFSWRSHSVPRNITCTEKILFLATTTSLMVAIVSFLRGFSDHSLYFISRLGEDSSVIDKLFSNLGHPDAIAIASSSFFLFAVFLVARIFAGKWSRQVEDDLSYWQGVRILRTAKYVLGNALAILSNYIVRNCCPNEQTDDFPSIVDENPQQPSESDNVSEVLTEEDLVVFLQKQLHSIPPQRAFPFQALVVSNPPVFAPSRDTLISEETLLSQEPFPSDKTLTNDKVSTPSTEDLLSLWSSSTDADLNQSLSVSNNIETPPAIFDDSFDSLESTKPKFSIKDGSFQSIRSRKGELVSKQRYIRSLVKNYEVVQDKTVNNEDVIVKHSRHHNESIVMAQTSCKDQAALKVPQTPIELAQSAEKTKLLDEVAQHEVSLGSSKARFNVEHSSFKSKKVGLVNRQRYIDPVIRDHQVAPDESVNNQNVLLKHSRHNNKSIVMANTSGHDRVAREISKDRIELDLDTKEAKLKSEIPGKYFLGIDQTDVASNPALTSSSHADACVIKPSKEKEFNTTRPTTNKASSSSSDYSSLVSLPRYVETVAVQADIATSASSSTQSLVPEETVESVQILPTETKPLHKLSDPPDLNFLVHGDDAFEFDAQPERQLRHRGAVVSSLFKRDSWHVMAENPEEEEGSACHGMTPGTYNEKSTQADLSKIDLPREKKPLVSRDPIGQECSDIALRHRDSVCRFTLKQSNIAPVPSAHGLQGSQSVFPLPCTTMQSHETTSGVSDPNNDLLNLKRGHCLHVITHRVYPPFKLGESPVEPSSKTTLPSLKYTTDSGFGSEQTLPVIPEPLPTLPVGVLVRLVIAVICLACFLTTSFLVAWRGSACSDGVASRLIEYLLLDIFLLLVLVVPVIGWVVVVLHLMFSKTKDLTAVLLRNIL